jgi:MFS family permease
MSIHQMRQRRWSQGSLFYGYVVVVVAFLITSAMWAVYYSFGIFFKPMLNEFGWTRAMTSGPFSMSMIINGILAVAMGGLTDKLGPRVVMSICGLLLGVGYIFLSQVSYLWQLYIFYGVIVGAGMGGSFIPLMSTVARWFVKKRNSMTGIVAAGIGVGAFIGPKVAGRLISIYGWRISYVIMGCTLLIIAVLLAQLLKRDPADMGLVAYGYDEGEKTRAKGLSDGLSLRDALVTSQFWVFFATGFCYGFCVFSIMVHIASHAGEIGFSAAVAANLLATVGGLSIPGKVIMGRAGDIIGSRQTMLLGFILVSAAQLWLATAVSTWTLFGAGALFGLSYGGCTVAHSPLVAVLFGLRSHGLILGVFSLSVMIGGAVGPFLTGYLCDVHGSYHSAFMVSAGISMAGALFTAILKQNRVN